MKPMILFATFLLIIAAFTNTAKAEQLCGQDVKVTRAYGTEVDSSGDIRDGVIAPKFINASMYFCVGENNTPISAKGDKFDPSKCQLIYDVVGLRLHTKTWSEGAKLRISSVSVDGGAFRQEFVEKLEISEEQPFDICFTNSDDIKVVEIVGQSTNFSGSQNDARLEFLVGTAAAVQTKP